MALINPLIGSNLVTGAAPFNTTLIEKSVWMDGSADGFTRAASDFDDEDGKEFTLGTWFQLTEFGVTGALFCAGTSGGYTSLRHSNDDKIYFQTEAGSAILSTPNLYRDIGWYHLLLSVDTTQVAANNRVRLFINGEEVIFSGTRPSVNHAYEFNTAEIHEVGDSYENGAFEGYLAQSFMIGSKSIQQGDFAITDFLGTYTFGTNGSQFIPKAHSEIKTLVDAGSDNSFLLDYDPADPTASNALGLDTSTYGNNFTSTSMGSANQSPNTPSKVYSIFNPLAHADNSYPGTFTLSEGNQKNVINSSNTSVKTTVPFVMSGSNIIRAQFTFSTIGDGGCGITSSRHSAGTYHTSADSIAGRGDVGLCGNGALVIDGQFNNSYTSALSNGDVVDVIVNCAVGAVYFAVDGTLLGGATQSEIQAGTTTNAALVSSFVRRTAGEVFNFYAFQFNPTSTTVEYNSGQSSFTHSYSTITSLKSLNTADLPAPDYQGIDYFDATVYEGNGTGQRVGDFVPYTDVGTISQSVAFNAADEDELRIAASVSTSPTNAQKKTVSCWLKPISARENWIYVGNGGSDSSERIYSTATGQLQYITRNSGSQVAFVQTAGAFLNDSSQWVHVVFGLDYTDGSTEADRVKIYVNGVRITDLTSSGLAYPANNMTAQAYINKASTEQIIGCHPDFHAVSDHANMYYAEYFMVDGHQLDASVFGQLDTSTNRWVPKASSTVTTAIGALSGGFGNCGFYLDFSNTSDYGEDDSGNNRDWTEGGVLDATNQFTDTPSKNYPIVYTGSKFGSATPAITKGGLRFSAGGDGGGRFITMQPTSGKWYFEIELTNTTGFYPGLITPAAFAYTGSAPWNETSTFVILSDHPSVRYNNGGTSGSDWGAVFSNGDRMAVAWDVPNKKIYFGKAASSSVTWMSASGASGGNPATGVGAVPFTPPNERLYFAMMFGSNSTDATMKFISSGWEGAAPTGFSELNQDNLDDTASKITAWSWIKNRDATDSNILVDRIRGVGKTITSDETSPAIQQTNMNTVQRFLQRGVQIGNDVTVNTANESYVLWQWLLGDSATTGSTTSPAGTIASTTIVADTGHFSIGSYTGNSTDNSTVGHGLGGVPEMILVRNLSRLTYGLLWHKDGFANNGSGDVSTFVADFARGINFASNNTKFGGTDETYPTANVFKIGNHNEINANTESLVFYAFRSIPGVCKVGSFLGNNATDGPYVSLDFTPRWIMLKATNQTNPFIILDTARNTTNPVTKYLLASSNAVEASTGRDIDFIADGIKLREDDSDINGPYTYAYVAMADIGGNGTLPPIYGR